MTGRGFGRTPLEVIGIVVVLMVMFGVGVLWGVGIVIGSIVGSALPGTEGSGIVAILLSFPDVGQAWTPAISSGLVWAGAVVVVVVFAPLVWRLVRAGRLADEGARWATTTDLQRAGLLISDRPLSHAEAEEATDVG